MRILIVHNLLWAHYKSSVFQALQQLVSQQAGLTMKVLQIARNERSRAGLETTQSATAPTYTYDYTLLFDRFIEDISLRERTHALLRQARAFRPDVIALTGYYDPAQLTLLLWAKATGIRVIMQNESTETDHQRGGWKERLKRWIFGQCDGFFCFGSQSAEYLIGLGVPPGKILLRKNAVDNHALRLAYERTLPTRTTEQQTLGLRPNNFIFVGRLIAYKNLPVLLTAFAQAQQQTNSPADWGLILLGDGPDREMLTQQIQKLDLADAVQLLPGRPWYDVPAVLALSNVLVLPSLSEPWGLVVNEAMACGLPVIVSNRCGCAPDLVHDGQNGFIFDPGRSESRTSAVVRHSGTVDVPDQPVQLVRQLLWFMNETVDVAAMKQAAEQLIEPYSPEAVAQEMLDGFMKITR